MKVLVFKIEGKEVCLLPNDHTPAEGVRPSDIIVMFEHGGKTLKSRVDFNHKDVKAQLTEEILIKYDYLRPIRDSRPFEDLPNVFHVLHPDGKSAIAREVAIGDIARVFNTGSSVESGIKIAVIDAGNGMNPSTLAQVFEQLHKK